ncbi:MAG: ATP-binding protein, partial [Candidatus Eremiobacteraeota bacterium]|nr:ATP-binding protein [Candidatus Eremiobacteraeota bacterium]
MLDLPRTKPGFVGRSNELNRLRGGLGEYPIVAVEGQAGTGKTSLVLELANELREKGRSVLWVQAREGWSTESVLLVLSQHWEIEFPPHLSTRQHLVRLATALARTKTYLFLDDFHLLSDRSTLFEVMKAHLRQVSVVLTGRTRVEADSIRRLDCAIIQLESLALDEVDRLLRQMLERHGLSPWLEPSLFGELKEKSLGSPLLCKLLVSLLLQGRLSTLKDLRLVQDEIYGLLIAELEQGLGAEELDLLRRLSVYRFPVPREALPEGESTDECLERLVDRLLVEPTPGRRFTVHDVFRDYYQSHLE